MWKGQEITCSEIRDFQIPDEVHGGYALSSESLAILPRIRRGPKCQVNTISSSLIIFLQSSSTLSLLLLNRIRFTILVFLFSVCELLLKVWRYDWELWYYGLKVDLWWWGNWWSNGRKWWYNYKKVKGGVFVDMEVVMLMVVDAIGDEEGRLFYYLLW